MNNPVVSTDVGSIADDDSFWFSTPNSRAGDRSPDRSPEDSDQGDESSMKMLSSDQDDTSVTKMIPDAQGRRGSVSIAKQLRYIPLHRLSTREASKSSLRKTRAKLAKHKEDLHLEGYRALDCRRRCGLLALAAVFLLSSTGTILLWATHVFENIVTGTMVISNSSNTWDWWRAPPVHPLLKVYIFNYTNAQTFGNGENLRVEEVGPFTFEESTEKVDVVFHPNSTLSFREKKSYSFLPEMSAADLDAKVYVPNIPFMAALATSRDYNIFNRLALEVFLNTLEAKPMVHIKVKDLLFGYQDRIFAMAKFSGISGRIPFSKFGLLVPKDGVSDNVITMHTGEDNMNRLGQITRFNGEFDQGTWATEECNRIEASDGSQFPPPMVSPTAKLYIYNRDMCRRMPLAFKDYVEAQGLPAYRFHMPRNVFSHPSSNPENSCFCTGTDSDNCLPSGVFNASPCAYGAPIVMSFPHFFLGDPSLFETVDGLQADPEKHDTFIDVHPKLGLTLGGISRLQLNVQVRLASNVRTQYMSNFKDLSILPVAWFELIVTDYPAPLKNLLYHATFTAHIIEMMLMYGLLGASIGSAAVLCRRMFLRRRASLELSNVQFMDSDTP